MQHRQPIPTASQTPSRKAVYGTIATILAGFGILTGALCHQGCKGSSNPTQSSQPSTQEVSIPFAGSFSVQTNDSPLTNLVSTVPTNSAPDVSTNAVSTNLSNFYTLEGQIDAEVGKVTQKNFRQKNKIERVGSNEFFYFTQMNATNPLMTGTITNLQLDTSDVAGTNLIEKVESVREKLGILPFEFIYRENATIVDKKSSNPIKNTSKLESTTKVYTPIRYTAENGKVVKAINLSTNGPWGNYHPLKKLQQNADGIQIYEESEEDYPFEILNIKYTLDDGNHLTNRLFYKIVNENNTNPDRMNHVLLDMGEYEKARLPWGQTQFRGDFYVPESQTSINRKIATLQSNASVANQSLYSQVSNKMARLAEEEAKSLEAKLLQLSSTNTAPTNFPPVYSTNLSNSTNQYSLVPTNAPVKAKTPIFPKIDSVITDDNYFAPAIK